MKMAVAEVMDEGGAPSAPETPRETRSPYLHDLHELIDDIETLFPEVVRVLRERIADLERFLAKTENPFIRNGAVAATYEAVQAVRGVMKRIVG